MVEADLPNNVDTVFNNIEVNSNPWGVGKSDRDKWAEELNIKRMKDNPDTDVLFWVGCAGSFDDRAKKVATSVVKILRAGEIDFAILGKEENCTGDPARRMGNEYLALQLMTQNVSLLNSYNFKEVITFCPHCFNNLANELPDFGGHYRVVHAVDYVNKLIKEGKLELDTSNPLNITYHDSCYLGRHNGIYSAPREILQNFQGITFSEMDMNQDKGLCCGAGGGRMFFELEDEPMAINKTRIKMAEDTGADQIGVSCPFCTIMLEDGAKNMNSKMEVIDLMEIVATNLKTD
jgi:Fe-S oxidoreductase